MLVLQLRIGFCMQNGAKQPIWILNISSEKIWRNIGVLGSEIRKDSVYQYIGCYWLLVFLTTETILKTCRLLTFLF
jgi:hypothetical protein